MHSFESMNAPMFLTDCLEEMVWLPTFIEVVVTFLSPEGVPNIINSVLLFVYCFSRLVMIVKTFQSIIVSFSSAQVFSSYGLEPSDSSKLSTYSSFMRYLFFSLFWPFWP